MSAKAAIYLDSNAGAPLKSAVLEALQAFLAQSSTPVYISNPSSIHSHGRKAKRVLAEARENVAFSIGPKTDPEQIVFTSSGSEANQLAIRSVLATALKKDSERPQWITSPVEHDSIRQMVSWFQAQGGQVDLLEVDSAGVPNATALEKIRLSQGTRLMSLLWVNNETGAVTNVKAFSEWARKNGVLLHIDAAQAWGKIPIDVSQLNANYVALSGHKIGALAGTGALWVARGSAVDAVIAGKQEKGRRGGTENLMGILTLGAAAKAVEPLSWSAKVLPIRDRLETAICERIKGTCVNSQGSERVANTSNFSFEGVEGDGLVMALDLAGYSVSSGSACSSGVLEPSHVLMAMGKTPKQAMAAVRVSLSDEILWEDLDGFVEALSRAVERVRGAKRSENLESSR